MPDAGGTKPVCQVCGLPGSTTGSVTQRTMADGKIYFVHPWHVADLAKMIASGAPVINVTK